MSKTIIRTLISSVVFIAVSVLAAYAKDLGVVGMVYPIIEKDALTEIEERARQVDWSKVVNKDKMESSVKNFKPKGIKVLPRAVESRIFQVDMTYTLEVDVTDKNGRVLYPKGFTFNPLDFVHNPGTVFIILNGADRSQVDWFKKSKYAGDINVTLMITDGPYYKLSEELKRPVFYAIGGVIERFGLQYVPSVVKQTGRVMEVNEIVVEKSSKKKS